MSHKSEAGKQTQSRRKTDRLPKENILKIKAQRHRSKNEIPKITSQNHFLEAMKIVKEQ